MQLGGALGVAVLGTALNIRFRDTVGPLLSHQSVPANIASLIEGSLGGALAVAAHVPGHGGQLLEAAARHGFVSGMDLGFTVAAIVVAVAAVVVLVLPPARPRPPAADGVERGRGGAAPSGVPVETTGADAGPGG
jgi:DHA2 family multidrug resistance protein-like MFS transporter